MDSNDHSSTDPHARLRAAALTMMAVAVPVTLALMLYVGRRNQSWLLLAAFAFWISGPFAVLFAAHLWSGRWTTATRMALSMLMIAVALGTVVVYSTAAFGPPAWHRATAFVIVPPVSYVVIGVTLFASKMARKASSATI
jgi:hypothetical protein